MICEILMSVKTDIDDVKEVENALKETLKLEDWDFSMRMTKVE